MLTSIGLIADIQYADIENGMNYSCTRHRYYRRALELLRKAVEGWKRDGVAFIINLGDTIDGKNKDHRSSHRCLENVLNEFSSCGVPVYHVWGNHDLYNFSQEHLSKSPSMNPRHVTGVHPSKNFCSYTHFSPGARLRIILLDTYDVSVLGRPDDDPSYVEAERMLQKNLNEDKNSFMGLMDMDARFVKFNGGISKEQLLWLDELLEKASNDSEDVLIFGHSVLETIDYVCLCWNFEEVLDVIHRRDCVLSYICGHTHYFYGTIDSKGVYHITLPGIIEMPQNEDVGHSRMDIYEDKIVIVGNRLMPEITISRPKRC